MTSRPFLPSAACAVLALVPTLSTVLAQSEDRALDQVRRLFDPTRRSDDVHAARLRALRALRGMDSAAMVEVLAAAYQSLEREAEPIARERARVLVEGTSLELARFRKDLDPLRVLEDEILFLLAQTTSAEAADAKLALLAGPSELPFILSLMLAHDVSRMRALATLQKALERSQPPAQAIAWLRALASLGPRGGTFGRWIAARLADGSPTVRIEAIRTLARIGWRGALATLVDLVGRETGRVQSFVVAALEHLTGERFGRKAADWQRWLAEQSDRTPPERPPAPGDTIVPKAPAEPPVYFGLPQEGQAILYVFDRSDSMERPLQAGDRRIDRSTRELTKALGELRATTRFNILAYSMTTKVWNRQLVPATPENVAAARRWLRDLELQSATSTYDALERAFQLAGSGPEDRFHELEIETIFFLSDGEPTRRTGGLRTPIVRDDPERILSAVRRWNPVRRVVVHTIGLGLTHASAPGFMRLLAQQNGGQFVAFP